MYSEKCTIMQVYISVPEVEYLKNLCKLMMYLIINI
jgi:hypothetical protein